MAHVGLQRCRGGSRLAQSTYSGVVSVLEKCLATRIFIELWL